MHKLLAWGREAEGGRCGGGGGGGGRSTEIKFKVSLIGKKPASCSRCSFNGQLNVIVYPVGSCW